jgi:hypothetical protein
MTSLNTNPQKLTGALSTRDWGVLLVLCGAIFLEGVDVAMLNVALPSIRADLGLSTGSLQWVMSAYVVGYGGFMLLGGRAADLFGCRQMFVFWLSVFLLFSGLGGFATEGWMLIVARFVTGVAAAFMTPAGLSTITTSFEEGPRRNNALLFYSGTAAGGFSIGLVVCGLLTLGGWRWVFFAPVVLSALILVAALAFVPKSPRPVRTGRSVELAGGLTVTAAIVLIVLGSSVPPTPTSTNRAHPGCGPRVTARLPRHRSPLRQPLGPPRHLPQRRPGPRQCRRTPLRRGRLRLPVPGCPLPPGTARLVQPADQLRDDRHRHRRDPLAGPRPQAGDPPRQRTSDPRWPDHRFAVVRALPAGRRRLDLPGDAPQPAAPRHRLRTRLRPLTIVATEDVKEEEQGLAGGLLYTSFQFGAALGLSATTAVNVAATTSSAPAALLDGYRAALWVPLAAALLAVLISAFGVRSRTDGTVIASGEPAADDHTAVALPTSR